MSSVISCMVHDLSPMQFLPTPARPYFVRTDPGPVQRAEWTPGGLQARLSKDDPKRKSGMETLQPSSREDNMRKSGIDSFNPLI